MLYIKSLVKTKQNKNKLKRRGMGNLKKKKGGKGREARFSHLFYHLCLLILKAQHLGCLVLLLLIFLHLTMGHSFLLWVGFTLFSF